MQVITALLEGRLESKRASLLLYALQTAAANVKNLPRPSDPQDLVRDLRALEPVLDPDEYADDDDGETDGNSVSDFRQFLRLP